MRIENGRMIYEPRECNSCQGKGHRDYNVLCPMWGKSVANIAGRVCPICGAKNKDSHKTVGTEDRTCNMCRGEGSPIETAYDSVPKSITAALPYKVYRVNRPQMWSEAYLGVGLVSVTDYGRHTKMTDDELIAAVKDGLGYVQAISGIVSREDTSRVCDHIGIVTSDNGYSVIGVFNK